MTTTSDIAHTSSSRHDSSRRVDGLAGATERAHSIDALRGCAIITMVLSATVAQGILPQWMYHSQTPPPYHVYDAAISGLTWVDLVFPFFLFAMGAAFPFSIGKRLEHGVGGWKITLDTVIRFLKLLFFAIFIQHFYPYVLSSPQDVRSWLLGLTCFALLFPMFTRFERLPKWLNITLELSAYVIVVLMLLTVRYADGRTFSLAFSNIIILILSNMALFGGITYLLTAHNTKSRLIVMAAVLLLTLGADVPDSWEHRFMQCSPFPYLLHFDYLRYLLIIIPGSIAGEFVRDCLRTRVPSTNSETNVGSISTVHNPMAVSTPASAPTSVEATSFRGAALLATLSFAAIVGTLYTINHHLIAAAFAVNALFAVAAYWILFRINKTAAPYTTLWRRLFSFSLLLMFLGLLSEVLQGGVKKDPATVSYLLVTSALALYLLTVLSILCDYYKCRKSTAFLTMSGCNPMIAYVAGDLLIYPIMGLTGLFSLLGTSVPILGFVQGVVLTALSVLVTMLFTKLRCFWRT